MCNNLKNYQVVIIKIKANGSELKTLIKSKENNMTSISLTIVSSLKVLLWCQMADLDTPIKEENNQNNNNGMN
jgi:hypothetical protein